MESEKQRFPASEFLNLGIEPQGKQVAFKHVNFHRLCKTINPSAQEVTEPERQDIA